MWLFLVILIIVFIFYLKTKEDAVRISKIEITNESVSEESIFKIEKSFEERLVQAYLPDAISGKEIYIYRKLMTPWYKEISSLNRYNDEIVRKIRNDWAEYMTSIEDLNTYNYLWLESEDKFKADSYREKHIAASKKAFAIQDAFAALIGKSAVDELVKINLMSVSDFDEHGNLLSEKIKSKSF